MRKVVCVVLCILGFSQTAVAGGIVSQATITNVQAVDVGNGTGLFFIFVNKAIAGGPACAAGNTFKFVADPNTPGGKAILATALIARVNLTMVTVAGLGTCSIYSGTETAEYILLPG
jgi:hypothetical protein